MGLSQLLRQDKHIIATILNLSAPEYEDCIPVFQFWHTGMQSSFQCARFLR